MLKSRSRKRTSKRSRPFGLGFKAQLERLEERAMLAAFTPGDLVVVRIGDGTAITAGQAAAVSLLEYSPTGTLVQTINLPSSTTSGNALTLSDSASEGVLALSQDGQMLTLGGYDASTGTASVGTSAVATVNRVIGKVGVDGTVDTSQLLTDAFDGGSINSVVTTDGSNLWVSGADGTGSTGGVRFVASGTDNTTTALLSGSGNSTLQLSIAGGNLYVSSASATPGNQVAEVGTGLPTTGSQTLTSAVTGTGTQFQSFYFTNLGSGNNWNSTGFDTLYAVDPDNSLNKYSFDGTSWNSEGSTTLDGLDDIVGVTGGTSVTIFGTDSTTSTGGIYALTDSSGAGATLVGTFSQLAGTSPGTNFAFRGLAIAPDDGIGSIGGLGNTTTYASGTGAAVVVGSTPATFSDGSNFRGGSLTMSYDSGSTTSDVLSVKNVGSGAGQIGFDGTNVSFEGVVIGSIDGTLDGQSGNSLKINFNGLDDANSVSSDAVQALINAITFNSSGAAGNRVVRFTVAESQGVDTTATSASDVDTVAVTVNQAPTIDQVNALTIFENASQKTVNLTGIGQGTGDTGQTIMVTATSSNHALFADPSVTYASADATGMLQFTPIAGQFGTSTITVTVMDSGGTTGGGMDTTTMQFVVTVDAPPAITTNAGLSLAHGTTATISNTQLAATDPDNTAAQIAFHVTAVPTHGTLQLDGTTLGVGDTFTQADIDNSLLSYTHDNSTNFTDSFAASVSDPAGNTGPAATFNITVTNAAPVVQHNTGTTVAKGGTVMITTAMLSVTDTDNSAAQLTYTIGTPPAHGTLLKSGSATSSFTQADIDNGLISYQQDGSASASDSFTFTVSDGDGGSIPSTSFVITLNQPPVLSTNTGLTVPEGGQGTIGTAQLQATDSDNTASQLTYTITAVPAHGTLSKNGTALAVNGTFTQADIDNNLITYTHDGSETTSDSFAFTVSDGSNTLPANSFALMVTPVNDPPALSGPASQTTGENTPLTFSTANSNAITINDPDAGSATIQLVINTTGGTVNLPTTAGLASIMGNGTGLLIATGSQANLNAALNGMVFTPTANLTGTGAASIDLTTNDMGNTGAGGAKTSELTVSVDITATPGFSLSGTTLTVTGTANADTLVITFTSATAFSVTLNGNTQNYTNTQVTQINFDAADGNDTATVNFGSQAGSATLRPGSTSTVSAIGVQIGILNAENETLNGTSLDTADLYAATTGTNALVATPTFTRLTGTSYTYNLNGLTKLNIFSQGSTTDNGFLYGGAGSSTLINTTTYTALQSSNYDIRAFGFPNLVSVSAAGANDVAYLYGVTGSASTVVITSTYATLTNGSYHGQVTGFAQVVGESLGNTGDTAWLYDAAGTNSLITSSSYAILQGSSQDSRAFGFAHVIATSTAGNNDSATLNGSAAGGGSFIGSPTIATFSGTGFDNIAQGFHTVTAIASGSGNSASLTGGLGTNQFVATDTQSTLTGSSFELDADNFSTVTANSGGSSDTAVLHASTQIASAFVVSPTSASMSGGSWTAIANGFQSVTGISSGNSGDTATFHGGSSAGTFTSQPGHASFVGAGFNDVATGFRTVTAIAGDNADTATLHDSSGDDLLTASGNSARLATSAGTTSVSGFQQVTAIETTGSDVESVVGALDFVLTNVGSWQILSI